MNKLTRNYKQEIAQIMAELEIASPSLVVLAGKSVTVEERSATAASSLSQNPPIVTQIQNALYHYCYCRRLTRQSIHSDQPVISAPSAAFVTQLSQANQGSSRWDSGWQVRRAENTGQVWAEKSGVMRILLPGEYMNFAGPGTPVRQGSQISIYCPRESTAVQPGLYFAFGETVMASDHLDMLRFYWNISEDHIVDLLKRVSRDLNRFQIPFQFKCSAYPHGYQRRDAAVLYVLKRSHAIVRQLITSWIADFRESLRDDVPLFTMAVNKGVSLAEDPATGESFGMNRCRHVAEAVWEAHTSGVPKEGRLGTIQKHFQRHGLDLNRPYLNAGSMDQYNLQLAG
jgi:hypothetical protein